MSAQPIVDDLIRETRRYEFVDGLVDLQMAVMLATLGLWPALLFSSAFMRLFVSLSETLGSDAWLLTVPAVVPPVLIVFGSRELVKYVRRRWLWRSSGFVEPLPSAVSRRALVLGTAIVVVATLAGFILTCTGSGEQLLPLRMLIVGVGWAQGVTMISVSRTTGLAHYARLGIVGALVSTAFRFPDLPIGQAWLAFCLLWGLAFTVSGLVSMRSALLKMRKARQDG